MLYLIQVLATTTDEVKKMIAVLDEMFESLKENVQQSLEKRVIPVKKIANALTSLSADYDDHRRMFLKSNVTELYTSVNHSVLFGHMNFHWNYLDPSLLNHLVGKFGLKEVKDEMEAYKSHLRQFRMKTPLRLFCLVRKRKRVRLSPGFQEVVAEFSWPKEHEITLEEVEQFRQEFASNFNLRDFAMMLVEVRPGSFIITWVVPQSIVEEMKKYVPKIILRKFFVAKLVIAGSCIYCRHSAEVYFSSLDICDVFSIIQKAIDDASPSICALCSTSEKYVCLFTVEPLNNGHVGDDHFVHCSEVVPSLEVEK